MMNPLPLQAFRLKPFFNVLCDFGVVHFLEHKVAVAVNADIGQVNHRCVTTVFVVALREIAALLMTIFQNPVDWMSAGPFSM